MDRYGLAADDYKYIVGAGVTVVIGSRAITISSDDLNAIKDGAGFNFSLDAPVVFPTVKQCYDDLKKTPPFDGLGLPEISWDQEPFTTIGGLQATIDAFEIDTREGTEKFVLAISFTLTEPLKLLFLEFKGANFSVKRVKKEA